MSGSTCFNSRATDDLSIRNKIKAALPQLVAVFAASTTHVTLMGFNMGYSAVFITQNEECQITGSNCSDYIVITEVESSWIASIFTIFIPVGAVVGSTIVDTIGRINLLLLGIVPGTIGWTAIGLANNSTVILLGRILNGIAGAWTTCSALVYVTEITSPKLRGSLASVPTLNVSIGVALVYTMGYLLHWRVIAWFCVAFNIISALLIKLIPKSPAWLVSRGRIDDAEKSLSWFNKYYPDSAEQTKTQLELLIKINEIQKKENDSTGCRSIKTRMAMFLEPTVYKPMFILPPLNVLVQFSGVYVILYYATTFFKAAGTDINPYLAAICFGVARVAATILAMGLMQRYGRRPLMVISGLGMAVSMTISGLYTKWIQEGTTSQTWVPLVMISLYVIATMVGFLIIPLTLPAELFPTAVRGMAQSISIGILFGLSFLAIFSYYTLYDWFGGSSGLQFFYAGMSIAGTLYYYVFVVETHNKKLHEIGEYFRKHTVYLIYSFKSRNVTESRQNIV